MRNDSHGRAVLEVIGEFVKRIDFAAGEDFDVTVAEVDGVALYAKGLGHAARAFSKKDALHAPCDRKTASSRHQNVSRARPERLR